MLRLLFVLTAVACGALSAGAQSVGDSTQVVETALGRPQMTRSTSKGDVWLYENGVRVTFKAGVVTSIEGLKNAGPTAPSAPAVPANESMTVVPDTTPPPASPRVETDTRPAKPRPAESRPSEAGPAIPPWKLGGVFIAFVGFAIVSLVCQVLILIQAFKTSIWWGLGSLFVPFVGLIFIISNWSDVRKPFLVNLGSAGALSVFVFMFMR